MYLILRFIFQLHWILWWNFWCTGLIHFTSTSFFWIYFAYSWCTGFYERNVKTHLILRGPLIVPNIPPKQHTIPADVLPNDSEDLYLAFEIWKLEEGQQWTSNSREYWDSIITAPLWLEFSFLVRHFSFTSTLMGGGGAFTAFVLICGCLVHWEVSWSGKSEGGSSVVFVETWRIS